MEGRCSRRARRCAACGTLLNSGARAADLSAVSDPIETLRKAVSLSPDNAPLRRHLGDLLSAAGRHEEALEEYREALALDSSDELRLALARTFLSLGRTGEAAVLVDVLLDAGGSSGAALVLKSRLLLNEGDLEGARDAYRRAVSVDAELADPELADLLVAPETTLEREEQESAVTPSVEGIDPDRAVITFADVGGMEDVKEEIRLKIIHPFQHPELYAAYGKRAGGGVLLYGPPGCGKTHVARATAGELGSSFLWVGLEDVLSMWFGESEQNLHELFEQARRSVPCVLFFDEVDALGARHSDMRSSPGRQLINQFLVELDGVSADNEGILILAATNAPWHVDDAFRRPGRFDRVVFVPPPDRGALHEIVRIHLEGRLHEQIDLDRVAARTEKCSGADLRALVDVAVEAKLAASMRDGVPRPITTDDLLAAARKRKPTTAEWFQTVRNYALHANQAGSYDAVLEYLGRR
jgi:SpoVK/Ycf46/Vps4 family AAA+-type ATPase